MSKRMQLSASRLDKPTILNKVRNYELYSYLDLSIFHSSEAEFIPVRAQVMWCSDPEKQQSSRFGVCAPSKNHNRKIMKHP